MHSKCIQNAFRMFQNAGRMFQNACRMHSECSRMFQNVTECKQNIPEFLENVPEGVQYFPEGMQNVPECIIAELHKLSCSYLSLHAVSWAYMQFLSSSEQLTRILQCLFINKMSDGMTIIYSILGNSSKCQKGNNDEWGSPETAQHKAWVTMVCVCWHNRRVQ